MGQVLLTARRGIARFALRDAQQHRVDARQQRLHQARDGIRAPHQVTQDFVHLGGVGSVAGRVGIDQVLQRQQPAGEVFKRGGLQLGTALQGLEKDSQCGFHSFAAERQPLQEPGAVEVAARSHPCRVRLRLQIALVGQLRQGADMPEQLARVIGVEHGAAALRWVFERFRTNAVALAVSSVVDGFNTPVEFLVRARQRPSEIV